jgi:hypothetical protein
VKAVLRRHEIWKETLGRRVDLDRVLDPLQLA